MTTSIEQIEQQLLERAADISRPIVESIAHLPDDAAMEMTERLLRDDADHLTVVASAYGCVMTRLQRQYDALGARAICGWCATAGDALARREVRALNETMQHSLSCANNPLVRAVAVFVLAFDSDEAGDSASASTREAFVALRRMIAS